MGPKGLQKLDISNENSNLYFIKTTINLMYTIFDYIWGYETKRLFENVRRKKIKNKFAIFGYWL